MQGIELFKCFIHVICYIIFTRLSERVNDLTGTKDLPMAGGSNIDNMPNKGKGRPKLSAQEKKTKIP